MTMQRHSGLNPGIPDPKKRRLNMHPKITHNKETTRVKSIHVPKKALEIVMSFISFRFEYDKTLRSVNKEWNLVYDQCFSIQVQQHLREISLQNVMNKCTQNKNDLVKRSKHMMSQQEFKKCAIMLRKNVPFDCYLSEDASKELIYHPNGIMEYMLLKYTDMFDESFKISTQTDHSQCINHFMYCIFQMNQEQIMIPMIQQLIKNYSPFMIPMRFQILETHKKNKNLRELYLGTQKCMSMCYEPVDIAKCYRLFSFYFVQKCQEKLAIMLLLKSAQFDTCMDTVRDLKSIVSNVLKKRIEIMDSFIKKQDVSKCSEKQLSDQKIIRTNILDTIELCNTFCNAFIKFIAQKRIYPLHQSLLNFIPSNLMSDVFVDYMKDQIPAPKNKNQITYFHPSEKKKKPLTREQTWTKRFEKVVNMQSVHNRKVFKMSCFEFDDPIKVRINNTISKCKMHKDETQVVDLIEQIDQSIQPSRLVIKCYQLLIQLSEKQKKQRERNLFDDKMSQSNALIKIKNMIDSNMFWDSDKFLNVDYMKTVVKLMNDNCVN